MAEQSTFRYTAEVTLDGAEDAAGLMDGLGSDALPDIDLLPPGPGVHDGRPHVPALLTPDEVQQLVRAGYAVTLSGYSEGPVTQAAVMADDSAQDPLAALLGPERMQRGGES